MRKDNCYAEYDIRVDSVPWNKLQNDFELPYCIDFSTSPYRGNSSVFVCGIRPNIIYFHAKVLKYNRRNIIIMFPAFAEVDSIQNIIWIIPKRFEVR